MSVLTNAAAMDLQRPSAGGRSPSWPEMALLGNAAAEMLRDILSMEYVHDLIYGHLGRLQDVKTILSVEDIDIRPQIVMTVVIDDFWIICENRHNRDRYEVKRWLLGLVRQAIAGHRIRAVATTLIGTDKVVAVVNCGDRSGRQAEQYAVEMAEEIRRYVEGNADFTVSIGVSSDCSRPSQLWRAYEHSFRALQGTFYKGKNRVLRYQDKPPHPTDLQAHDYVKFELIAGLGANDLERCRAAIDELLNDLTGQNLDEHSVKSHLVVTMSELSQYCILTGADTVRISADIIALVGAIFRASSVADLHALVCGHLEALTSSMASMQPIKKVMGVAQAYIDQFHGRDLSLREIALLCGYSPSYFSRCFKEFFGITFVQYIMKTRVAKAKALLRNPDLAIGEVAEKCGFKSMSYFSAIFKKETGDSPVQFKQRVE